MARNKLCRDKFQIKPCHRRWSSIKIPYVDRRDKLKWIIIKEDEGKRKKKELSELTKSSKTDRPWRLQLLVRSIWFCSISISIEYWMDIVAMHEIRELIRHDSLSSSPASWLGHMLVFFVSFHHVRSEREGDEVYIHPQVTSQHWSQQSFWKFIISVFKESLALAKEIWMSEKKV